MTQMRQTYNVHDGEDVILHVLVVVILHHLVVDDHQGLHIALQTDGSLRAMVGRLRVAVGMVFLPSFPQFLKVCVTCQTHTQLVSSQ